MGSIKKLREAYGLTRNQLADLFSIPLRTVQSWELGERSCPVYLFLMMEELLKVKAASGALERFRKDIPVAAEPEDHV